MPEVGQHVHAAGFELGGAGVLVLVDHVLVDAEVHQPVHLRLDPGLTERRQVLARVAVEQELIVYELVGVTGVVLAVGHAVLRQRDRQIGRREHVVVESGADTVLVVEHREGSFPDGA